MFVFLYKWKRDVNKERSSLIKRRDVAGPPNPSIIAHALSSLRCHDAPPYSLIDMSHDPELSLTRAVDYRYIYNKNTHVSKLKHCRYNRTK